MANRRGRRDGHDVTRAAMKAVHDQLGTYTLHWCSPLKLWVFFQKLDNRYWNPFGVTRPDPEKSLQITVEVSSPLEGIERKMGGASRETQARAPCSSYTAAASAADRRASGRSCSGAGSAAACR